MLCIRISLTYAPIRCTCVLGLSAFATWLFLFYQAVYRAVSVRRDYCRVLIAIEMVQRVWRGGYGRAAATLRSPVQGPM